MDERTEKIITIIAVLLSATFLSGLILVFILYKADMMDSDQVVMNAFFLSGTLSTVVIIYAALIMSDRSAKQEYLEYIENKVKDSDWKENR